MKKVCPSFQSCDRAHVFKLLLITIVIVENIVIDGNAVAILAAPRIVAKKKMHAVVLENIVAERDVGARRGLHAVIVG